MPNTKPRARWGITYHLEQEVRPDVWKHFKTYATRSAATVDCRKLVTGGWRVIEVASRIVWVHEPERRKAKPAAKRKTRLIDLVARAKVPSDAIELAAEGQRLDAVAARKRK